MSLNRQTQGVVTKSQLKYDELNEGYYYEDSEGAYWGIFDDNMYYVNDVHSYSIHLIKGNAEACNIAVLMATSSD